ncbi:MAG: ribose-phosphate pyrophosphokinase [Geminicoccales bacterium]
MATPADRSRSLVDIDRLEALLIEAARERRSLTYAEVLASFKIRITPRRVYALCRDLGQVCERNRARGEPELAVLVVRKTDRLPGEGFFHSLWRDGAYDGPATGPEARAYIWDETEKIFAFWAGRPPG